MTVTDGQEPVAPEIGRWPALKIALASAPMWLKIMAWGATGVLVAGVPMVYGSIDSLYGHGAIEWNIVFARGDGLLLAGAVCGTAIGELVSTSGRLFVATRIALGMLAGIVLLLSTVWYCVAVSRASSSVVAAGSVLTTGASLVFAAAALVVGIAAVVFTHASEQRP